MTLDGLIPPALVLASAAALVAVRFVYPRLSRHPVRQFDVVAVVAMIVITGAIERQMGRPLTYRRGPVRVWSGDITSDQNSQQIADPYTFTHLTHGALFYGLTSLALPSASLGLRLLSTIALEGAWESYENTRTVIERYRAATISLGYYGDSVLNSICDILACAIGFWLTARLPRGATLGWVVASEVLLALWIRDNLTLNILMLVYPIPAIKAWQAAL
jgi:Protein of unknown function (DUF2585)